MGFSYEKMLRSVEVTDEQIIKAEQMLIDANVTLYGAIGDVDNIIDGVKSSLLEKFIEGRSDIEDFNKIPDSVAKELNAYADKLDGRVEEFKELMVKWYCYQIYRLPAYKYTKSISDVRMQLEDMVRTFMTEEEAEDEKEA